MQLHMQADGMSRRILTGLLIGLLISSSFFILYDTRVCKAITPPKLYVDDDYNNTTPGWQVDHFSSINDAINASSPGYRIIVLEGSYNEVLNISHQLDIFGEGKEITTIDGQNNGNVISINSKHVNISHFTIKNSGNNYNNSGILINKGYATITDNKITSGKHGITINNCDNNIIYDNEIYSNSGDGIYLYHSDDNDITYNKINNNQNGLFVYNSSNNNIENNSEIKTNEVNGVFLNETSKDNIIANNNISSNTMNGIFLNDHCNQNKIDTNQLYSNLDSGIRVENSSSNTLQDNNVNQNNKYGVMIVGSQNTIKTNNINKNQEHGLFLFADDYNTIYNNNFIGNIKDGIHLTNSSNDTIHTNKISSNSQYGIYLDYFTKNNLIYNNYLYDNTDNAIDKSLGNNQWNITKTSGENKIGGSYLCGNYWDDYDETIEGAIDSENDGIADDYYTIYAANKDYGPILDTVSPTIKDISVSPNTETIGGTTHISAVITDNTEIKNVYLHITKPNNQITNFSIKQNKTDNTYFCNKIYSLVGTYTFHIAAKDPRNWAESSTLTFYIDEGTPPTITDNSPTTGSPSASFTFNATVIDDMNSPSELTVNIVWNHNDKSGNQTMVNVHNNYFIAGITLDNSIKSLSYHFYAEDQWENHRISEQTTVDITDNNAPEITITKNEYQSDEVTKKYIIGAKITDEHKVNDTEIEYWYGDTDHKKAELDKKSNSYFEKTIQIGLNVDKVYCILKAYDPSNNQAITGNPYANASGPYTGIIGVDVTFNGSNSFDLDGEINSYEWNFGDGTTGTGAISTHSYSTNGNYDVTLTVTDNEDNTDSDKTTVKINQAKQVKTKNPTLKTIQNIYHTTLTDLFYSYDSDGDNIVDTFVDPNQKLKKVHDNFINISGNICFLISVDDQEIPEFIWNSTTDKIIDITYKKAETIDEPNIDLSKNIITQNFKINKTNNWIYLEANDPDIKTYGNIKNIISVTKNNSEIKKDRIIRKDKKTYILDDPDTIYQLKYSFEPPVLTRPTFSPSTGNTINEKNQTILITYNVPVRVIDAAFYMIDTITGLPVDDGVHIDITNKLSTSDEKKYSYTPPSDLNEGYYEIYLFVRQKNYTKTSDDTARYNIEPYAKKEAELPLSAIYITIAGIGAILVAIYIITRYKNINLDNFIYFKNKKIIPFFKPVVFGPLQIDVNDDKIKKAEFYVNGKLKNTVTESPYILKLNEPMFKKQKIETRVYDQQGNTSSSGEITFYILNPPRFFT